MIFVFVEDGTLEIAADLAAVRVMCEPIDVESSVFRFYDAEGRPLRARFTTPNRQRKIIGMFSSLTQGEYTLEPAASSDEDPVSVALQETATLEPNPFFSDLNAVRRYLADRGAL